MKATRITIISGVILILFVAVSVSAGPLDFKVPARYGSASKDSVLEKISTTRENNLYSSYQARLIQSLVAGSTSQTPISISESLISGSGSCTSCSGVTQYTLINQYSSVPAYYPDATQVSGRGYGTLVVVGPDDGNTYYLWIKSQFFALDVAEGYNMRWHGCNSLPVIYENNILSGTYCLKVTTGPTIDSNVVWCGTAEVASNMTTTVRVLLTPCPLGCSCC
jgi:hypothetical protein